MYDRSRSGQFLHFSLVGLYSGQILTGVASGAISGRRTINGGSLTVCSGPVYEVGGGMYRLDLHSEDAAGDTIGFLFSSSGSIPVVMTVATQNNVSGKVYGASGLPVTASVWSGQLSGQGVTVLTNSDKSGYTAGLISGVNFLASGHRVSVYSGQLSGQPVDVFVNNDKSGYTIGAATANSINAAAFAADVDAEILSYLVDDATRIDATALNTATTTTIPAILADTGTDGVVVASGLSVVASVWSGQLSGQGVTVLTNSDKSGYTAGLISGVNFLASGHLVNVYSGNLSGQEVVANATVQSGLSVVATIYSGQLSGHLIDVLVNNDKSGYTVGENLDKSGYTAGLISGVDFLASGIPGVASIWSGQLSGHQLTARTVIDKSGYTAGLISGVTFLASGHLVNVYSGNLSGQEVVATATVPSGLSVVATIYSGQLSGHAVDVLVNNDKSGYTVGVSLDKSGYTVGANLDKSGYTVGLISGATYLASGVILKEVLTGAFSGLPDVSGQRNLLNAARKLMNAFDLSAASGHLSVYREDDSTLAYRQAVTVASGAQPIGGLDTV